MIKAAEIKLPKPLISFIDTPLLLGYCIGYIQAVLGDYQQPEFHVSVKRSAVRDSDEQASHRHENANCQATDLRKALCPIYWNKVLLPRVAQRAITDRVM